MVESLMKTFKIDNTQTENIPAIPSMSRQTPTGDYIPTVYHQQILKELKESIQIHDICLIGNRGSGKGTLIRQLANVLSLKIEPITLYQVIFISKYFTIIDSLTLHIFRT
jgi:putative ribosome biogenesis GTPase RsgA